MWAIEDIDFTLVNDFSADPIATLEFRTPAGVVLVMGEPRRVERTLFVTALHIQGLYIGANSVGTANLRAMAEKVMDYDAIVVQGAARTSGANPSRRPGLLRFARRRGPAAGSSP